MPKLEDRKLVHDVRNSMTVIRNLTQLIQEGKMPHKDQRQAFELIIAECNKVIKEFEER